jgi:hypothetical protein
LKIIFGLWKVPEVIYQVLEEPISKDELKGRSDVPQTLEDFMAEIKTGKSDAKTFAIKLREMVPPFYF